MNRANGFDPNKIWLSTPDTTQPENTVPASVVLHIDRTVHRGLVLALIGYIAALVTIASLAALTLMFL